MKAVIASNNPHKVGEIKEIMKGQFEFFSLEELELRIEVVEDGNTFLENALKKAKAVSELANLPALADDSGLEVEALDFAPGVYSARFAGEKAADAENNALLLQKLSGEKNRKARFTSVVVLYFPDGKTVWAEGHVNGEILDCAAGGGGFGYDPLFYSYELKKTFGEATPQEKNSVSHRARALSALAEKLKN